MLLYLLFEISLPLNDEIIMVFEGHTYFSCSALSPDSESEVTYTKSSHVAPSSETRMERLLDTELPADKSSDTGISCEAEDSVELGAQFNEFDSQPKQIKFLEVTPPGTAKSCVLDEGDPLVDMADGTRNSWLPANIGKQVTEKNKS